MGAPTIARERIDSNTRRERPAGGRLLAALLAAGAALVIDQGTKWAARSLLTEGVSVDLLGPAVRLTLVYNTRLAFGTPVWFGLAVIGFTALLFLVTQAGTCGRVAQDGAPATSAPPPFPAALLGIGLGSAAGNLIDRLVFGAVVDFIEVPYWPVFNIADVGLTLVALLLAWRFLRGMRVEG